MNTIKRDVYVLRNTIKIPIEVTKGTDAISFEFTVRDYNLPATAAAVAYAYRMGMKKPNSTLCDVSGNVISFQPSANFFEVGNNELQIRVINEDKSLISFKEKVKCSDSMGFPDEEEEVDQSLIEQIIAQSGKESGERKAADAQEREERIEADAKEKSERLKEIATERARIDQLTKMGEGSTTGDAELADIRVGNEGATYSNAGNAVRSQTKDVPAVMDNLQSPYVDISLLEQGSINSAVGSEIASSKVLRSVEFHWNKNGKITAPAGYKIAIANYAMQPEESGQMTKVYMSFENYSDSQTSSKADGDAESRRLLIKRSDGADINAEDLRGKITTNVLGLRAMDVIENLEKKIKTDTTLEKEGVAADAAETGKRISQVEGDIDNLSYRINLFDETTIVNGGYYNSDGTIGKGVEKSQYSTQYIPIKQGVTYTWSKNTKLLINTCDSNLQNIERLITYSPTVYTSKVFDDNVKFIRLSVINDVFGKGLFMFVEGKTLPSTYVSYNRQIGMKTVTNLISTLDDKLGYIKETSETDFNNITESGYYVITNLDDVNAPTSNSSGLLIVLTGAPNGYQSYQIFSQYLNGRTYIRNQRGKEWGEWSELTNINEDQNTLGIKKIAWFGDSISALKDLPSKCADLIKCNVVNCAIPGAVMVQNIESNKRYTQVGFYNLMNCLKTGDYSSLDEAYNAFIAEDPTWEYTSHITNFKNIDWNTITTVVVFYGTNDYCHGVLTMEEYKSKMKEAFTNLMSKYPTIQIYAITPTWRADGNNKNKQNLVLYDYVQAVIDVCSELNITCYNLYKNSYLNSYTKDTLLVSDGLHLTNSGAKMLSEKLSRFLLSN